MFPFGHFTNRRAIRRGRSAPRQAIGLESLENRQLLSVSPGGGRHGDHGGGFGGGFGGGGGQSIAFSLLPTTIRTGLNALATTDGLTDPTATTPVALGNQNGVETYTVTLTSTGTVSRLTVDAAGNPVTVPTQATTTFGALATAPAAEITAIATAGGLTAPASTTTVHVTTTAAGLVTSSVFLAGTTSSTDDDNHGAAVMVDAAGNPVGNQRLPLSVFSTAVQNGLTAAAPTGATALTSKSTVAVRTADGVTTYSVTYVVNGTATTVLVDKTGAAVTPAGQTTSTFGAIPSAAQVELQAIATAKGYTGTLPNTQAVTVCTDVGDTTTLYAVTVSVTTSSPSSSTATHDLTLVVDASGNPTVLTAGGGFGDGRGPGDFDGGSTSTPTPTTTGSGSSGTGTAATTASASTGTATTVAAVRLLLPAGVDAPATPTLGAALALFASAATDSTVAADLATLKADAAALRSTVKGLNKTDAATLRADEKAAAAAIKALSPSLTADEKALKSDTAKSAPTLRADLSAARRDRSNATALAADQAKLAADEAAAFTALSADLDALRSVIAADAGVTAAQSKLATDLPAFATAEGKVQADYTQLEGDIGSKLGA